MPFRITKCWPAARIAQLGSFACYAMALLLAGCTVGPKYQRATVDAPPAFKEADGWKVAQPQDDTIRGKWWEVFGDAQLNALEEQASSANQNIAAAAASFLSARAIVKQARAQYYPTLAAAPTIVYSRQPIFGAAVTGTGSSGSSGSGSSGSTGTAVFGTGTFAEYLLPFDASWQPDLWGRVRNTVRANTAAAQASAADLQNVKLTAQAEVAVDYFEIRAQDAQKQLLDETVKAYQDSADLTRELAQAGIYSDEDLVQAETQLETAQAQDTDLGILRAQYEHAIAVLTGKPPAEFSLAVMPLDAKPPAIPPAIPSQLLERRPDIAAAERKMAQQNAQVGVARAAYYPNITLSPSAGFESTSITTWLTWPSRFFSVGPTLAQTLFDGGARRGALQQAQANYDQTVAMYRQTVLTAFQQVEDNLAALRMLSQEVQQEDTAVTSSQRYLSLANQRYKVGIDPYLNVITAQATLLTNQRTALNLRMQQMTASVQLIEALGGGWDASQIPAIR